MSATIYEVNLQVAPARADEYRDWLRAHVAEIVSLPGFVSAQCFEVDEPVASDGWLSLCVHYRLADAAALRAYLEQHAPRLRGEGVARFGSDFRAQRRIMHLTT